MSRKSLSILVSMAVLVSLPLFLWAAGTDQGHEVTGSPAPAPATDSPSKLLIAIDAAYPPFEYVDTAVSEIVGFDIDLMKEIAKAGGFEIGFINTPWDGIFEGLYMNNYDAIISAVSITDERKIKYDFSDPYYRIYQALLVRKADAGKYKSLADLKGKRVGAQIGTTAAILIAKDASVTLVNYDDNGLAIDALLLGDVDAVVCDHPWAYDSARVNPAYFGKLVVTNARLNDAPEPYAIVVKKGNTKVLDQINRGIRGLDPGVIPRLETKWKMK